MSYQLRENIDYTIELDSDLTSFGKKQIIIKAQKYSDYVGQFVSSYILYPIINESTFEWIGNNKFKYTSAEIKPKNFKLTFKEKDIDGSFFSTEYDDNIEKGTGKVKIKNVYDATDQIYKNFSIYYSLEDSKALDLLSEYKYTGKEIKPTIRIQYFSDILTENTEYKLEYSSDLVNVGTKNIQIKPGTLKTYEDKNTVSYKIVQADISEATVTGIESSYTFSKKPIVIDTLEVKFSGSTLTKGTDYSCQYKNNVNVGKATITLKGINNFKNTIYKEFNIVKADITTATVEGIVDYEYTGEAIQQENLKVKLNGTLLEKDIDYQVQYSDNINVGKAKIKIIGINNLENQITNLEFNITKRSIASTTISGLDPIYEYEGKEIKPTFILKYNDYQLVLDTDYTCVYKNYDKIGTASIEVTGINTFSGSKTFNYEIVSYVKIKLANNDLCMIRSEYTNSNAINLRTNYGIWREYFDFKAPYDKIRMNDAIGISSGYITSIGDLYESSKIKDPSQARTDRAPLKNIIMLDLPQLKTLGVGSLACCNKLKSLKLPNAQTLKDYCLLSATSLNELSCQNAKNIGEYAFYKCENMTAAYLNGCVYLGNGAFQYCSKLNNVEINSLSSIHSNVFDSTGIRHVSADSVKYIDSYGIANNSNLTSITLKNFIGFNGQFGIYRNEQLIANNVSLSDYFIVNPNSTIKYVVSNNSAKAGCKNIVGIFSNTNKIKSTTRIDLDTSFEYDITIDNNVFSELCIRDFVSTKAKSIGDHAFKNSYDLSSIQISNVEEIGNEIISGCKKLKELDISNAKTIGSLGTTYSRWYSYYNDNVFYYPKDILSWNVQLKTSFEDPSAFDDLNSTQISNIKTKLNSLDSSVEGIQTLITQNAFSNLQTIKKNIKTIVSSFSSKMSTVRTNVNSLSSYLVSLEEIHSYSFECMYLDYIVNDIEFFQGSERTSSAKDQYVEDISNAEDDSYLLSQIKMRQMKNIDDEAFVGLHNLTLSDEDVKNIEYIGTNAFKACTSLTKLKLNNVLSCEYNAFDDCSNLKEIQMNKLEVIMRNHQADPA